MSGLEGVSEMQVTIVQAEIEATPAQKSQTDDEPSDQSNSTKNEVGVKDQILSESSETEDDNLEKKGEDEINLLGKKTSLDIEDEQSPNKKIRRLGRFGLTEVLKSIIREQSNENSETTSLDKSVRNESQSEDKNDPSLSKSEVRMNYLDTNHLSVTQGRFTRKARGDCESSCDEIDEPIERPFSRLTSKLTSKTDPGIKHLSDSVQIILSSLYCKLLVICGAALAIGKNVTDKVSPIVFHLFYMYLFLGSVLFLFVIYMDLIRYKVTKAIKNRSLWIGPFKETCSERELRKSPSMATFKNLNRSFRSVITEVNRRPKNIYGSFYLRIGALLFGSGSMIYSVIEMGHTIEAMWSGMNASCVAEGGAVPPLQIVFVFVQMYFIFLNLKMSIYKHKWLCRFGMMHMIATNLCVWLNVLVTETEHEIAHHKGEQHIRRHRDVGGLNYNNEVDDLSFMFPTYVDSASEIPTYGTQCNEELVMKQLVVKAAPFLFPCTIEYSLICAAVLYTMWKHIDEEHEWFVFARKRKPQVVVAEATCDSEVEGSVQWTFRQNVSVTSMNHDEALADVESEIKDGRHGVKLNIRQRHHYSLDCSKASNGLFCGIFICVLTVITIIVYFMLETAEEKKEIATQLISWVSLIIYSLALVAVIWASHKVRKLRYDSSPKMELDTLLLVVGQTGVFVFAAFSFLSSLYEWQNNVRGSFLSIIYLVQATLQTIFILDASNRSASNEKQQREKPGREMVTFLLISNLAMWTFNALVSNKASSHPMQNNFYSGDLVWPIITHVSMPLAIFYRFHSTVCLCGIWSKTFKLKDNA